MSNALKLAQADNGLWFLNGHVSVAVSKAESADGSETVASQLSNRKEPPHERP
jgi:hypothetical protein